MKQFDKYGNESFFKFQWGIISERMDDSSERAYESDDDAVEIVKHIIVENVAVQVLVLLKNGNNNEIVVVENVSLTYLVICVPDFNRNIFIDMVNQEVAPPVFDSAGNNVDNA